MLTLLVRNFGFGQVTTWRRRQERRPSARPSRAGPAEDASTNLVVPQRLWRATVEHAAGKARAWRDNCSYNTVRDDHGKVWLAVMTPTRGQRLRLDLDPLPEHLVPTSTIQIGQASCLGKGDAASWSGVSCGTAYFVSARSSDAERPVSWDRRVQVVSPG